MSTRTLRPSLAPTTNQVFTRKVRKAAADFARASAALFGTEDGATVSAVTTLVKSSLRDYGPMPEAIERTLPPEAIA
jgi:hypothetical protein